MANGHGSMTITIPAIALQMTAAFLAQCTCASMA